MHYSNGRLAKVGDKVVGKVYNLEERISGTLLSITPGPDNCSALVGYLNLTFQAEDGKFHYPYSDTLVKIQGTEQHGTAGPQAITTFNQDYTHCGNLLHVDDLMLQIYKDPD